jgi:hypothetical protein
MVRERRGTNHLIQYLSAVPLADRRRSSGVHDARLVDRLLRPETPGKRVVALLIGTFVPAPELGA